MLSPPIQVSSVITCAPNHKTIQLLLTIETTKQNIGTQALVDSGAEGIFINSQVAEEQNLQ